MIDINDSKPVKYLNVYDRGQLIKINVSKVGDSTYYNSNTFSYLDKAKNKNPTGYAGEILATINTINPTLRNDAKSRKLIGETVRFETMYDASINLIDKCFNLY